MTTHQRTTRQETMPAVIQTRKGVEKHINGHTSANNTELGGGTPWVFSPEESFLLRQTPFCFTAGPRFTLDFLDLPEHRCYYLSFFPFVPKSILPRSRGPGRAPKCSALGPSPRLGKKTPRNNATCNWGIYYWLEPGPPTLTKGVRTKGPEPQFSQVFIRSKKSSR